MKKPTKDEIIKSHIETIDILYKKIEKLHEEKKEVDSQLYNFRDRLTKILYPNQGYNLREPGLNALLDKVANLSGQSLREGQMISMAEHYAKEENAKLWYLVRMSMGDKNLTEPITPDTGMSKFNKPNF